MKPEEIEAIRQAAVAAFNYVEPAAISSIVLLTDPVPTRDGYVQFTPITVTWRPHITMRDSWVRVHVVIDSYCLTEARGVLPSRRRLRLAVEQGRIRDALYSAIAPLHGRIIFPQGWMYTWTVGSALYSDEPLLGEHEYMRATNIDVPEADDTWSQRESAQQTFRDRSPTSTDILRCP